MNCCQGCGAALEGLRVCQFCGRSSEETSDPGFRASVKEFTVTVDGVPFRMRESWEIGLIPRIVSGPKMTHSQGRKLGILCRIRELELGERSPMPGQTKEQTAAMWREEMQEVA